MDDAARTRDADPPAAEVTDPPARDRAEELDRLRDRALVEQALRGDLEAFNRLVALYRGLL